MRRLVLFDIDGTLLRGGPAKSAFEVALEATYGTTGAIETHEFSGKTDPQIARELLTGAGLSDSEVDRGFPGLWSRYETELERALPTDPPRILPGIRDLLDALDSMDDVALGLVTGNIATGATLKLGAVGLAERFDVGGFGSDDEDRLGLPAVARRRARNRWGVDFAPDAVVIVGDTHRDVACGLHGGHRTVAVATGRISAERLREAGAHHLFDDFRDTARAVSAILA